MHFVLQGILDFDRQKRTGPDVKGNPVQADAALTQAGFQRWREMQAGRGGGNRAFVGGEHGLVVGRVVLVGRAFGGDIGRQRRATEV
jgi:hypothetical protein